MKKSRPALQAKAQEECGVWLDTVQLKEKKKKVCRICLQIKIHFINPNVLNVAVKCVCYLYVVNIVKDFPSVIFRNVWPRPFRNC